MYHKRNKKNKLCINKKILLSFHSISSLITRYFKTGKKKKTFVLLCERLCFVNGVCKDMDLDE